MGGIEYVVKEEVRSRYLGSTYCWPWIGQGREGGVRLFFAVIFARRKYVSISMVEPLSLTFWVTRLSSGSWGCGEFEAVFLENVM